MLFSVFFAIFWSFFRWLLGYFSADALESKHSKVEAIPLSALPKDTTSKLAALSPH